MRHIRGGQGPPADEAALLNAIEALQKKRKTTDTTTSSHKAVAQQALRILLGEEQMNASQGLAIAAVYPAPNIRARYRLVPSHSMTTGLGLFILGILIS